MTIDDLEKLLFDMNSKLSEIDAMVKELHKSVFGNGHEGLSDRVLKLEERQKHSRAVWVVLGFVVNAVISLMALFK